MTALHHQFIDNRILRVSCDGQCLFDYVYRPDTDPRFGRRPYLHPIHTLAGDVLTNVRPTDHPWHVGLSLTLTSLNEMNFWGGPTYLPATKDYHIINNVGTQLHTDWLQSGPIEGGCAFVETLEWIGPKQEHVLTEKRTLTVCDLDLESGFWRLVWESELTNTLGEAIRHHSYCSGSGLAGSGYTGLFIRMSRNFERAMPYIYEGAEQPEWDDCHDGENDIEVEKLNDHKGTRLAYQGLFDSTLNGGLMVCEDLTGNPGYEHHWFYRRNCPCIAWSTAFHDPLTIEKDATFTFKHALGIASGFWTKERAATLWSKPRGI